MALATTPTYSTLEEFKAYTPVSAQKSIAEADWKPYALRAEVVLDSYVTVQNDQKFDVDQPLKFPIKNKNDLSYLPNAITMAVIDITSDLILKGDSTAQTGLNETSENWSGDGYSVTKQKKAASSSDDIKIEMPPLARRLLLPWTQKTCSLYY